MINEKKKKLIADINVNAQKVYDSPQQLSLSSSTVSSTTPNVLDSSKYATPPGSPIIADECNDRRNNPGIYLVSFSLIILLLYYRRQRAFFNLCSFQID